MYNRHLSIEEIDQLNQQKGPAEHQVHVENCQQCKLLLDKYQIVSAKLENLVSARIGARNGMNCPEEKIWFDVAAGNLPDTESAKYVQHASECSSCAKKLKNATHLFQEELTEEEEQALTELPGASPTAQRQLAKRLAGQSRKRNTEGVQPKTKWFSWKLFSYSLAGAAVAVSAILIFVSVNRHDSPADVEKLLADDFTQDRRIQMRPVYSHYSEWRQQRGPDEESLVNLPGTLRNAADIIASSLKKNPTSSEWLVLEAQLDLLQGHYHPALEALGKVQPSSSPREFHLTLGNALLQRAESESDKDSYLEAINEFSAALDESPNSSTVLFNRALAYDRLNLLENALQDWQSASNFETDPGWRDEISQYITADKSKLEKKGSTDLLSPQQLNSADMLTVDAHVEQLQDLAILSWLPAIVEEPNSDITKAVFKLASILRRKHSDPWLSDTLKQSSHADVGAFIALAAAIRANSSGHYADAFKKARQAADSFNNAHNQPGELRARFEEVYAVHRFLQGPRCLTAARLLIKRLSSTRYRWLQAQALMEKAVCENFASALESARHDLALSRRIAERSHYLILVLRNLGLAAGIDRQQGQLTDALNQIVQGLNLYWAGDYPRSRLYQFYMALGLCAEQKLLWNAAESVERMAVRTIDNDADKIQRGTAQLQLVNVLVAEKKDKSAAEEMAQADAILADVRDDPLTNTYRLTSKIELSTLQLDRGNSTLALDTLNSAAPLLTTTQGYFISLSYYRAKGDTYLSLGRLEDASSDYLLAVRESEESLQPLKDEAGRLRWLKERDGCYRGLVRVALEEKKSEIALRLWEWYRTRAALGRPSNLAITMMPSPSAFSSMNALAEFVLSVPFVHPNTPHVVYVTLEDGLQIWVFGPRINYSTWVAVSKHEIVEKVTSFAQMCATLRSPLENIQTQGRHIYELLLAPVIPTLADGSSIVLEPDDSLVNLPFEAVFTPGGEYLGEKYELVYSPGYLIEEGLRKPRLVGRTSSVVLVEASEIPLAGHESERNAILSNFPISKVMDASTESWHKVLRRLAVSDVGHFVAHGEPDGTGTALLVSDRPRRVVRAENFGAKYLNRLQLAVLAACTTQAGREDGLLDTQNLVHAFLSAGVPKVIAARWNIDSNSTAELMSLFYRYLLAGDKPAAALLAARRQLIQSKNHPYFWSGISLIGRAEE